MIPILGTRQLSVGYRTRRSTRVVLDDLELWLEAGTLTCLLGPNGSGKSTLLRTISGMQPALAGSAVLLGDDVARLTSLERARRLAVVLTDPVDVGILRAVDLVALGRYPHTDFTGRLRDADRHAVQWALEVTGSAHLATRSVAELSDGERQRVLIARALAQQPALLALDEPVAFVDLPRRVELLALLRTLARETGLAILLTTHDLDLALRGADVVWLLEPREQEPARVHVGAPEDLALSGAIGQAFSSAEVRFDLERATFVPTPGYNGSDTDTVGLLGTGTSALWVARALEREGLRVVPGDAPVTVEACEDHWLLRTVESVSTHPTVAGLVAALRVARRERLRAPRAGQR